MKTTAGYSDHFGKASNKSAAEIRRACEALETSHNPDYIVKHNGNHIWLEMAENRQEFWSPLLHLELRSKDDKTFIRGEYVERPLTWVAFLLARIIAAAIFTVSLVSVYLKSLAGEGFKTELLVMFTMVSVWFFVYVLSQWNKKKATHQAGELHNLMESITT